MAREKFEATSVALSAVLFFTLLISIFVVTRQPARSLRRQGNHNGPVRDVDPARGDLRGMITTVKGKPLSAVTIVLVDLDTYQTVTEIHTGKNGLYAIKNLPVGEYELGASLYGYSSSKTSVRIRAHKSVYVRVVLKEIKGK